MSDAEERKLREIASRHLMHKLTLERDYDSLLAEETNVVKRLTADPARGPQHIETVLARRNRATTLALLHRDEEALAEYEWVLPRMEADADIGWDAEDTVIAKQERGNCLLRLNRRNEALEEFTKLEQQYHCHPQFGTDHPTVNWARDLRTAILIEQMQESAQEGEELLERGEWAAAAGGFETALSRAARNPALGPDHPTVLALTVRRAQSLWRAGLTEDALAEFTKVTKVPECEALAEGFRIVARHDRAVLLWEAGDTTVAAREMAWVVDVLSRHPDFGPESLNTARARVTRGRVLTDLNRHSETATELAAAVEVFSALGDATRPREALEARLLLALAKTKIKQYLEAVDQLDWIIDNARGDEVESKTTALAREFSDVLWDVVLDDLRRHTAAAIAAHVEGRFEHATDFWRRVTQLAERHPDLGPDHPDAQMARRNGTLALRALKSPRRGKEKAAQGISTSFSWSVSAPDDGPRAELAEALRLAQAELEQTRAPATHASPPIAPSQTKLI